MRKIWDLPGGIHPPENKHQSLGESIGTLPLPEKLIIPLNQHIGAPSKPCVAAGEKVLKGQVIALATGYVSTACHAPTSGQVTAIGERQIAHPSGKDALCIEIKPDGEERWIEHSGTANYRECDPVDLLQTIREAGIAGLGGAGFPAAVKLAPGKDRAIDTLIINATECEPYITADDALMRERAGDIVEGIQIVRHLLGNPANVLIGIEDNKPQAYDRLEPLLKDTGIELLEFHTKYPSGGEKQLIYILTGKEVPSGGLPADIGIICQNIGTVYAIKRAVVDGEPLISRVTTVTGRACSANRNYETLIGTPVRDLLTANGFDSSRCSRVIMGGPMMGFALPSVEVPIIKTTNCILAPDQLEVPADVTAQPCIRCGLCAEACPVALLPQQMFWYAQSQNHERIEAHSLFDCIECGACSYVCPSNIPLVQYFRAAKGEIRKTRKEKIKSDYARERFEFRKARLEEADRQKEEKRKQRRAAATQAVSGDSGSAAADIIAAAQARAAERKATPEQQLGKLQRTVTAAEHRLQQAEEQLTQGADESAERRNTLLASVENARIQLEDARRRLVEFEAGEQAVSRVAEKVTASPHDLLQKKIEGFRERIHSTELKIAEAEDDGLRDALQKGLEKQRQKLADAESQLAGLTVTSNAPDNPPEVLDAAAAAIEKARAKAAQRAAMSDKEKLRADIESLEKRLAKSREKLAAAEAEGSEHLDALRGAADKLEQKLSDTRAQLEETSG